jgi:hypothetical protein
MSDAKIVLAAFRPNENLPNAVLVERTGMSLKIVSSWVAQLRAKGYIVRVTQEKEIPVIHRLAVIQEPTPQPQRIMIRSVWDLAL